MIAKHSSGRKGGEGERKRERDLITPLEKRLGYFTFPIVSLFEVNGRFMHLNINRI